MKLTSAALALMIGASAAAAQDVRLVSTDGLTDFSGELVSFDGDTYELSTRLGTIRIPADEMQCIGDPCPQVNEVASAFRIVGASSILRFVVPELLDAYSLEVDTDINRAQAASGDLLFQLLSFEGDVVVDVELTEQDAANAIGSLADGSATLGITTRKISDAEARTLAGGSARAIEQRGLERVIGMDGLVLIVGSDVTVDTLTLAQVGGILSGQITNWSDVGGPDLPISAFTREGTSEVRTMLDTLVMDRVRRDVAPSVINVDSAAGVANAVRTFPNSIGVASISALEDDMRALAVPDACGVPVEPSVLSIKTGTYPLSSPVYIYETPGAVSVHARGLVDFAQSTDGQRVMERTGYVDLLPKPAPEARIPAEGAVAAGAARLSTTVDIERSGQIDTRDLSEIGHLADYIRGGQAEGQNITFVGLADSAQEGSQAAKAVLAALFDSNTDIEENLTIGFSVSGATLEDAGICGMQIGNAAARVQVWIRPMES